MWGRLRPHIFVLFHQDVCASSRHDYQVGLHVWVGQAVVVVGAWDRESKGGGVVLVDAAGVELTVGRAVVTIAYPTGGGVIVEVVVVPAHGGARADGNRARLVVVGDYVNVLRPRRRGRAASEEGIDYD